MKKTNRKRTLVALCGIIIAMNFLTSCQFDHYSKAQARKSTDNSPSPSEVVREYWNFASSGMPDEAEALITYCDLPSESGGGVACGKAVESETYAELIHRLKLSFVDVESEKIRGRKAIVVITMLHDNNRKGREQYNLLLTRDGWRISSFHSARLYPCEFIKEDCETNK